MKNYFYLTLRRYFLLFISAALLYPHSVISAKDDTNGDIWSFLSIESIGARQFIQTYPNSDGRGVVIFILDSGVDMSVPGLQKTSTGETKVIDVQDFTGQGDVELYIAEIKFEDKDTYVTHPNGLKLFGYDKLALKPANNEYLIGYLDEERFINSKVEDINNNYIIDDHFGILVFETKLEESYDYVAYIDTDADGHIDDEKPLRDYQLQFDTFQLRGRNPKEDRNLLTFALNILEDEMLVSIHFDDGGHGTHVAGIAAGYQINNQKGLNGVAPGAKIISLKVGKNTLAGSATVSGSIQKAFNYGLDYIRKHQVPAVFNLSYGTGSENEGRSDLESFIDQTLTDNENSMVCLSGGNIGPGISSAGNPASASRAISTGALLPRNVARDVYGASLQQDKILVFSARGGEVYKPDVLAPGAAISTVPAFRENARMQGTSMASPHTAGAVALLMSASLQQISSIPIKGALLKRALKNSASLLPYYSFIEQGRGVPNVPRAFEILKQYHKRNENNILLDYEINTECPSYPDQQASVAYWRTGGYFPPKTDPQFFYVNAIFPNSLNADQKAAFFRSFELQASHDWLKPDRKFTFIKGESQALIEVVYEADKLRKPGVYTGKITAHLKGDAKKSANTEFELLNTIIIPHQFHALNSYEKKFLNQKLSPGDIQRIFVLVPPAASTMQLEIQAVKNKWCAVNTYIFDPEGHRFSVLEKVTSQKENKIIKTIPKDDLQEGIWEIVTYTAFIQKSPSYYNLEIRFTGFDINPPRLKTFQYEIGEKPKGAIKIINRFNQPFKGSASGVLAGYKRARRIKVRSGNDSYHYRFKTTPEIEKIVFEIEMTREVFHKFTDIALNIVNIDDKYIVKDGMNFRKKRLLFKNSVTRSYTLELLAAFADPDFADRWSFILTEYHYLKKSEYIQIQVNKDAENEFQLYPGIENKLTFTLESAPKVAPSGFTNFGLVFFKDKYTKQIKATLPISLKTDIQ